MFCDFCECEECKYGIDRLYHAQTADGSWICDVCYTYDLCTSGPLRNPQGPCDNKDCSHRPRIVSDWIKFKENA